VEKDPAGHDEQTASDARFAPGQQRRFTNPPLPI
jgi:hypothetical protein